MTTKLTLREVPAKDFVAVRDRVRRQLGAKGLALHPVTDDELGDAKCYLVEARSNPTFAHVEGTLDAGFVVTGHGELCNLFNDTPWRLGAPLVASAIERGAFYLDVYEGKVADLYREAGFVEQSRLEWSDEYAPDGWDFDTQGRPDVVYMVHSSSYID